MRGNLKIMENKELKERFIDEKTGIEYRLVGDYYIPNITIPKARRTGNIGKYGRLKLSYMKKYKIPEYLEQLENINVDKLYKDVSDLIESAKVKVVSHVNTEFVILNWNIGNRIKNELLDNKKP